MSAMGWGLAIGVLVVTRDGRRLGRIGLRSGDDRSKLVAFSMLVVLMFCWFVNSVETDDFEVVSPCLSTLSLYRDGDSVLFDHYLVGARKPGRRASISGQTNRMDKD